VVEIVKADGVVDNVRQAALYCISIAIENNGWYVCLWVGWGVGGGYAVLKVCNSDFLMGIS